MFDAGVHKNEIARAMSLGYTTVCKYIANKDLKPKSINPKGYCINANKDDFDFVSKIAKENNITKNDAMSEIVRLAKRKCLFSWG